MRKQTFSLVDHVEADPFVQLDEDAERPCVLMPTFTGDKFRELVQFGIIVERWAKAVGPGSGGKIRREWLKQFTEAERKLIGYYQQMFARWHLATGTPRKIQMNLKTLQLLQRAVHFFATN
jgi:hypothetical protein